MRTHARRDGSDWVLNGTKMWITNGTIADVAVVWARTDDGAINGFLVERACPASGARDEEEAVAARLGHVGARARGRARARGEPFPEMSTLRGPLSCLNEARYGIVWGAVGAGRACFESALEYAKERMVFEKPIAGYQLTQQKLAEMALEINRATLVALHLGRMKDDGTLRPEHVSMGKMGNVRGALEVAARAHDPRRQRNHARVPGHPAHEQPRVGAHVRGHARGAHARRRGGADWRETRSADPLQGKPCFPLVGPLLRRTHRLARSGSP